MFQVHRDSMKAESPRARQRRRAFHRPPTQLRLEELEPRLVPSGDLLANAAAPEATPDVHVLTSSTASPSVTPSGLPAGFSPQQISQAYRFNQITFQNGTIKGDGSGQTIAIVDAYGDPTISSDLASFDSMYGLAAPPNFTVVNETGGSSLPSANTNWDIEQSLDVEWAHAMAPGANILLVEAGTSSMSDLTTAVNYARNQPGVSVVSMSWGSPEYSGETSYDSYFTTPSGHNGVTFVASTGDSGSSGAPEYVSVSPNVLAVGGTQLSTDSSGNYLSETGWSGSGGGISAYESQPSYQKGVVTQTSTMRAVPDVAYNGSSNSPYAVYDTSGYSGWIDVYGTSAGAPQWAALVAIADQGRALNGQGTLNGATQALPALYQLPSSDFHDITSGSNGGYSAGTGYDLVTGLGSPLANQVVAGLVSYGNTSPPSPPAPVNQGPWVATPASATPSPVTGTTTNLSVLGGDSGGASSLTYTWSVLSEPSGAPTPTFSINASNAAQNTTATFHAAGTYTFEATITDTAGLSVVSEVTVTVNQTLSSLTVAPGNVTLLDGGTQQFTTTAKDQFGNAMNTPPSFTWTLTSGAGTLGSTGLYTAPNSSATSATVQVAAAGLSATASVTVNSAPAAPSNLTATVISTNQVNLAWTDNGSNATGVVVQRSTNGGAWTTLATLAGTAASYSDTSVTAGSTYSYRVYADNSVGNSAYSNAASVTVNSAPAAPSNLTASIISTHQVNLAWTDNGSNATGVVVQRSTNGGAWTTLATLAGTAASYSDTSVSAGSKYSYRVYADNSVGNSPYSNAVSVTISNTTSGGKHGGKISSATSVSSTNNGNSQRSAGSVGGSLGTTSVSSASNGNWQQTLDMLWADLNFISSLLTSISELMSHGLSTPGHPF